jgi:hypothetical protein
VIAAAAVFAATLGATLARVPVAAARAATVAQDSVRMDGEYGLYVRRAADSVFVRWITRAQVPGSLTVLRDGREIGAFTTPESRGHAAAFVAPASAELVLRYGALNDASDRTETAIRPHPSKRPPVRAQDVDSIFVVGDIHGEFDTLIGVLTNAGVIEASRRWSAGRAHLAVAGDMLDRGADATRVLWFLYALERQAEAAGGRVDVVLGNHEVMVMLNDLRDVAPKESAIAGLYGIRYDALFNPRESVLGRWLASRPSLIRIDDVLIAHGGASAEWLPYSLQAYDDTLAKFVGEDLFRAWADSTVQVRMDSTSYQRRENFFWGPNSVFWFRGYAQSDTLSDMLKGVLRHFDSTVHVIAHTPGTAIRERYGGALIAVNTSPFAAEILLLVREGDGWKRTRYRASGPPLPLGPEG